MPLLFMLNTPNAAIFAVKRRQCCYFCCCTPLTPPFFRLHAVNAFIPTKKTLLMPLFFRLNAVKAFTPTKQRRRRRYFSG